MAPLKDKVVVGSKVIIAHDADLRGDISIGSGTVLHPRATVMALAGPISIGSNCIVEETAVIINRRKDLMKIGDENIFEVGCRVEAPSVGSLNVFEARSRVPHTIRIGNRCVIGAGCVVLPDPFWPAGPASALPDGQAGAPEGGGGVKTEAEDAGSRGGDEEAASQEKKAVDGLPTHDDQDAEMASPPPSTPPPPSRPSAPPSSSASSPPSHANNTTGSYHRYEEEVLPDRTVVFGAEGTRRTWSGEGQGQARALHAKHLEYLRETIPKFHQLRIIS